MVKKEHSDIFVVGGGPAGLAVSIAAARKGLRVTVADGGAPPIDKTCGEGLMPETLRALRALGVCLDATSGACFQGIRFVNEGLRASARFPGESGMGLRRPLLHERMIRRAEQCGVQLLWNTPVMGIEPGCVVAANREFRAEWIVGADGAGSRVRRWAKLEGSHGVVRRFANRRRYRMRPWCDFMEIHWGQRNQAYVTPIGPEEVCIALVGDSAADVEIDETLATLPELELRLNGAEIAGKERGAVTFSRSLKRVQKGNVALIGDASGSVDAITGEGLRLAFCQAQALADAIAVRNLESYQRAHRELARRPMLMARLLLFLGRHPRLRRQVFKTLAGEPKLFVNLLAFHAGAGSSADILSTGAALGWNLLATRG